MVQTQGSHRNLIIKFHDFSMTIYAIFHDARKANTENNRTYSSHTRKESQIYFQTENKESKRRFASYLTLRIGNLEHKPKASHSQITAVGP